MTDNALTPVAAHLGDARRHAESGALRIDLDAAQRLLDRLADLRSRTGTLAAEATELDRPLRFGDNWVGHLLARRLRAVAVHDERGVAPALTEFSQVLDDLENTVRLAAGVYRTTDDETVTELRRCGR
ncbi:hypothetical protein [Actinophytocola sp. NPDC049390]|uniref:hypothetical protein n=1 Tax=Actinophytocola sp. NPDC049390 TaxID=3363894 RepID=UPI0037A61AC0